MTAMMAALLVSGLPLIVAAPAGAQATATVSIVGPAVPVEEGQKATFTIVALAPPQPNAITLQFSTLEVPFVTADPGSDYVPVAGRAITLSPANNYRVDTSVIVNNDATLEGPELLLAQIHNVSANATRAVPLATAVISASDTPVVTVPPVTVPPVTVPPITVPPVTIPNLGSLAQVPSLSVNDVTRTEGHKGTKNFVFTVTRKGNALGAASVGYHTEDGSAKAGSDYSQKSGSLFFNIGQRTRTISVPVTGDRTVEKNETFSVKLTFPIGAFLSNGTGRGTILDDDRPVAPPRPRTTSRTAATADDGGYWLHDSKGQVYGFGNAAQVGGVADLLARSPHRVVAMATSQGRDGVWLLDDKGGVYSLGSAKFFGSMPGLVNAGVIASLPDMVDIAAAPGRDGYTLLSRDGGVFTFGGARFYGSLHTLVASGVIPATPEAAAIAYTPTGKGYWIVSVDGGVFSFGDASFHGSMPGLLAERRVTHLPRIVSLAAAPGGNGYMLVDEGGGVFTFGAARFHGSIPGLVAANVIPSGINARTAEYTSTGNGYWIFSKTGGVYTFGGAGFFGATHFPEG